MKKITFVVILFIIIASQSPAQVKSGAYNLRQCIEIAKNNNTEIILANAQMDAQRADITGAFGEFLPSINFNMGYQRQLDPSSWTMFGGQLIRLENTQPNSYNMGVSADYVLFNGFAREANYNRSQKIFDSYYENVRFTEDRITLTVYRQYVEVMKNLQILKLRKENYLLGQKELERINAQYKAGTKSIAPVYAQEADLGAREFEIVGAENALNIAKANLLITMGLNPDSPVEFADTDIPDTLYDNDITKFRAEVGSSTSALNQAIKNRSDYAAAQTNLSAANYSLTIAESSYYPRVYATGSWNWGNNEFSNIKELSNTSLGLGLQIPIFDNFNTNQNVQSAKLQIRQRELEQFQTEQSIRSELQTAFLNLEAAEKQVEIAERSLRSAAKSFESMSEMYRVGSVNFSDYLTANNQYITSGINRINAVYSYFLAKQEVLYAMGKL